VTWLHGLGPGVLFKTMGVQHIYCAVADRPARPAPLARFGYPELYWSTIPNPLGDSGSKGSALGAPVLIHRSSDVPTALAVWGAIALNHVQLKHVYLVAVTGVEFVWRRVNIISTGKTACVIIIVGSASMIASCHLMLLRIMPFFLVTVSLSNLP